MKNDNVVKALKELKDKSGKIREKCRDRDVALISIGYSKAVADAFDIFSAYMTDEVVK